MSAILDIVIVNYNSTKYTISCIESVKKIIQNCILNVIVVDNGSKTSPVEILGKIPNTKLIRNSKNIGFAKGVNLAFKQSVAEFVLLLNPDTILLDGFSDNVYEFIKQNNDVAIIGPAIYETNGDLQGSARKFPTILTSLFGRKSLITKWFPNNTTTKNELKCFKGNENVIDVDWVSGACMIVRRKAFESVKGFDEKMFLYWEDADLCKRLKDKSWRIVYYPQAKIKHFVGKSSNSQPIASIVHFHYSCYKYFLKHTHGLWRLFSPFVSSGLILRCVISMALNLTKRKINGKSL